MKELEKPLWTFLNGYFVSTNDTFDKGLETMVFPAENGARTIESIFTVRVVGVDFEKPFEEFTRHYQTVEEAKKGHKDTVKVLRDKIRKEKK